MPLSVGERCRGAGVRLVHRVTHAGAVGSPHLQAFGGLVIIAIAGSAVDNVAGIQLAGRDRVDYALSVTLQGPVQVALVVAPVLVLISRGLAGATLGLRGDWRPRDGIRPKGHTATSFPEGPHRTSLVIVTTGMHQNGN